MNVHYLYYAFSYAYLISVIFYTGKIFLIRTKNTKKKVKIKTKKSNYTVKWAAPPGAPNKYEVCSYNGALLAPSNFVWGSSGS